MLRIKSDSIIVGRTELVRFLFLSILFLMLILYFFISSKIIWSLYLLYLLLIIFSRKKLSIEPFLSIVLVLSPLIWALLMSFNSSIYHITQGFFYASVPILMVLIGFQLNRIFTVKEFLSFIIVAGNLIGLLFIAAAILKYGFGAFLNPYSEARFALGSGSPACVLSLVVACYSGHFGIKIFTNNRRRYLSIIINLVAIWLFASRTYWVILFFFILMFSIKILKKDRVLFFMFLIIGLLALLITVVNTNARLSFSNSLLYKLVHSFTEIRVTNFDTYTDIVHYFRGYESYRSWVTFTEGSPFEIIFGGGLGKLVNLDTKILLAGSYWTEVPWVHNGFFYILVKAGLLGLIFSMLFFIFVSSVGLRNFRNENLERQFLGIIIFCCALTLFLSNIVICGFYNIEMALTTITIGFILPDLTFHNNLDRENLK